MTQTFADVFTWREYDSAAEYKARYGRLPTLISGRCMDEIDADPEAFDARVRAMQYADAMAVIHAKHPEADREERRP